MPYNSFECISAGVLVGVACQEIILQANKTLTLIRSHCLSWLILNCDCVENKVSGGGEPNCAFNDYEL